jgi:hypothetical protein
VACSRALGNEIRKETNEMTSHADVMEERGERHEAHGLERAPARIPSNTFLFLGGASILASAALRLTGRDDWSLFVGQWAPTFFILGTFSKLMERTQSRPTTAYAH